MTVCNLIIHSSIHRSLCLKMGRRPLLWCWARRSSRPRVMMMTIGFASQPMWPLLRMEIFTFLMGEWFFCVWIIDWFKLFAGMVSICFFFWLSKINIQDGHSKYFRRCIINVFLIKLISLKILTSSWHQILCQSNYDVQQGGQLIAEVRDGWFEHPSWSCACGGHGFNLCCRQRRNEVHKMVWDCAINSNSINFKLIIVSMIFKHY